jgi:peptide/nickel transport system permease protein
VLPSVTLGWFTVAGIMRITRSAMLDVLDSEYIKLARVKGVPENVVIWNHAMRNAAIPVVTFLGLILGNFLTGFVVVETIFSWPGVGLLAIRGIQSNDFAIIQTVVMFGGLLFITINFLVDIFYGYLDPRIRYE